MASPFRYFRKNQGYILAVLGVILIVTWVIGPSLTSLFETNPQAAREEGNSGIVAKWKLGNITRGDLKTAGWEHEAVIRFLLSVVRRAQEEGVKPQAPFLDASQEPIELGLPMRTDDPTLVQVMLFAQKGKEMGIVIDHPAMMDYLTNLGGFALSEADFHELARQTVAQYRDGSRGTPLVTVTQLFDRLKLELTSLQAQAMFSAGLTGFSTGELWEYHEQLPRRNKIEALPIPVADYYGRFKESDAKEEELRKIYDEGKDRVPHPERSEPGFRQPQRLAFGYVKIDFQQFLDAAKKEISEEQLAAEYQKEIAAGNFRNLKFDAENAPTTPPDGTDPAKSGQSKTGETKTGNQSDAKGEKAREDKESPAGEDKAGEQAKEEAKGADQGAKESKSCQEEPQTPTENAAKEKSAEGKNDAKSDAKQEEKPADPAEKPAEGKPANAKPDQPQSDEAKTPEPEFRPLSEVRDQLLTKLATPAAQTAQNNALNEIVRAVSDYGTRYTRWVEDRKAESKVGVADPGALNLSSLAKKHSLVVGKTPLADQFAIAATELGQQAAFRSVQGTVPFADGAFFENRPLYAPQEASSISGETTFVYWRTQQEASVQVPFDKARKQVVAAWIHQQAVSAAKKEAEALAAKAAKAASLKEVLSEEQAKRVVEPLPFSWLTRGASPLAFGGSPSLTEVKGIPLAGSEFMKSVFSLDVGQAGIAVDQPHKTVYVVRVVAEEPALDIRREMFLSGMQAGMFGDLISYARMASRDVMGDAIEELREEYQLKWLESPQLGEM